MVKVLRVDGFDTDALETFTTDPYAGFLPWNREMMVFIDGVHDLEITGLAEGPEILLQRSGRSTEEIVKLASEFGFPENHVILRPDTEASTAIKKTDARTTRERSTPMLAPVQEWPRAYREQLAFLRISGSSGNDQAGDRESASQDAFHLSRMQYAGISGDGNQEGPPVRTLSFSGRRAEVPGVQLPKKRLLEGDQAIRPRLRRSRKLQFLQPLMSPGSTSRKKHCREVRS